MLIFLWLPLILQYMGNLLKLWKKFYQQKVLPSKHIRRNSQITLRTIPRYNLRSDNYTHQRRAGSFSFLWQIENLSIKIVKNVINIHELKNIPIRDNPLKIGTNSRTGYYVMKVECNFIKMIMCKFDFDIYIKI